MYKVDVIIPTYKPDKSLLTIIEKLNQQSVPVNKIILMNTEEGYFGALSFSGNVEVYHHSKPEFDHGATRNAGVAKSAADIFIMMTQDAIPTDEFLVESLCKALEKDKAAVAYARQLPAQDCGPVECFTRSFNYPDTPLIKSAKDLPQMGVKTYFCSNVCAAYKKAVFTELGGFVQHTIFNEDMIYAAGAVKAGYSIIYEPQARVIHSHNYSFRQQFRRNFDLGVSQAEHPEVFEGIPSESEGIRMVRAAAKHLFKTGRGGKVFSLVIGSGYKLIGYKMGRNYKKLSRRIILKCTANKEYWTG